MRAIRTQLLGLFVALLAAGGVCAGATGVSAGAADSAAPAFDLVTIGGEAYSDVSLRGKPALLVFWAPWCRVCQRELPRLAEFCRHGKPAQLQMLAIGFADSRSHVEGYVEGRPDTFVFPTAYDEDRWTAQAFRITATPTYVVLDATGHVVLVHRGGGILENAGFRRFLAGLRD